MTAPPCSRCGPKGTATWRSLDQAADPYLAIGCLIAAGLAGIGSQLRLPTEITVEPAACHEPAQP